MDILNYKLRAYQIVILNELLQMISVIILKQCLLQNNNDIVNVYYCFRKERFYEKYNSISKRGLS